MDNDQRGSWGAGGAGGRSGNMSGSEPFNDCLIHSTHHPQQAIVMTKTEEADPRGLDASRSSSMTEG